MSCLIEECRAMDELENGRKEPFAIGIPIFVPYDNRSFVFNGDKPLFHVRNWQPGEFK